MVGLNGQNSKTQRLRAWNEQVLSGPDRCICRSRCEVFEGAGDVVRQGDPSVGFGRGGHHAFHAGAVGDDGDDAAAVLDRQQGIVG